jgi:hypothetical protein
MMKTHRETYPEQYSHPYVGETLIRKGTRLGRCSRVVASQFGLLAVIDGSNTAWLVSECQPEGMTPVPVEHDGRFDVGARVQLTRDVDRYPHFLAKAGMTGTVVQNDRHALAVRMDAVLPGCEEWDNQILWVPEDGTDAMDDLTVVEG